MSTTFEAGQYEDSPSQSADASRFRPSWPLKAPAMTAPPETPANGLEAVFSEMRPALIRRALAMGAAGDAEDVVQDVWLKLRSNQGPIASPHAYLLKMVYTAVLDRRRGARRAAMRDTAWSTPVNMPEGQATDGEAERRLIAVQTLREVEARLEALGDPAAAIFRRHRIDGVPQRRIAEEFGMGLSTVEKHLRRAYALLLDLQEDRA
jgi:RNA polymerase sigma factor (sigma-70 family)